MAIKTFPYSPVLGWSASRYDVFSICKRRYYLSYYGKHDQSFPPGLIGKYKDLVSIPLETGGIVHEVIRDLLDRLRKATTDLEYDRFFDHARDTTGRHLRSHRFQEVVYAERPAVEVDDVFPKVQACLENLVESDRYNWLVNVAAPTAGEWIIDRSGYGETRLDNLKMYCKVDSLFPVDGHFYIIDWKTGKAETEKHHRQMVGYAAWACHHLEIKPETVTPVLAYLHPAYMEVEERFDDFDLQRFSVQVRAETEEMYTYCADRDQNIPLGIEHYAMRDDSQVCVICKFRGLCHPAQYCAKL